MRRIGIIFLAFSCAFAGSVNGPSKDGTEIACHLPESHHVRNKVGIDNLGLCVFASMRHTGDWQDEPVFFGLFEWMTKKPGGGWPSKFDRMVEEYARSRGLEKPDYIQVESNDLEILRLACKTGRMPGVTYSFSPTGRYGGRRISHMVSLVHADERFFVVLDNNYPGTYEWLSPEEFLKSYRGNGQGWCIILLNPSPPPIPKARVK